MRTLGERAVGQPLVGSTAENNGFSFLPVTVKMEDASLLTAQDLHGSRFVAPSDERPLHGFDQAVVIRRCQRDAEIVQRRDDTPVRGLQCADGLLEPAPILPRLAREPRFDLTRQIEPRVEIARLQPPGLFGLPASGQLSAEKADTPLDAAGQQPVPRRNRVTAGGADRHAAADNGDQAAVGDGLPQIPLQGVGHAPPAPAWSSTWERNRCLGQKKRAPGHFVQAPQP